MTQTHKTQRQRLLNHPLLAFLARLILSSVLVISAPIPAHAAPPFSYPGFEHVLERADAQLVNALQRVDNVLTRLQAQLEQGQPGNRQKDELRQLRQTLKQLDRAMLRSFERIEQHINDQLLPDEIRIRHYTAHVKYEQTLATLLAGLDEIDNSSDSAAQLSTIDNLKALLNEGPIAPIDTAPSLELAKSASTTDMAVAEPVAKPLNLTGKALAPQPDDLAPTVDAPLTAEITALAQSLNNNPVAIFNWVHDHIDFVLSFGSLQGAALTLATRRGNAHDTASLLIALLRAASIPARYGQGTAEIPLPTLLNMFGNVTTAEAALELLSQGGIPHETVVDGGEVVALRLAHVWVEAWVDFEPSRGAIHIAGDRWIPMDASFKRYHDQAPVAIPPASGSNLSQNLTAHSVFNTSEGWVSQLDAVSLDNALSDDQHQLDASLGASATVADALGQRRIISAQRPILAAGLPYRLTQRLEPVAVLADTQRHYLTVNLYANSQDAASGSAVLSHELVLPAVADQSLSLRFVPATPLRCRYPGQLLTRCR